MLNRQLRLQTMTAKGLNLIEYGLWMRVKRNFLERPRLSRSRCSWLFLHPHYIPDTHEQY